MIRNPIQLAAKVLIHTNNLQAFESGDDELDQLEEKVLAAARRMSTRSLEHMGVSRLHFTDITDCLKEAIRITSQTTRI